MDGHHITPDGCRNAGHSFASKDRDQQPCRLLPQHLSDRTWLQDSSTAEKHINLSQVDSAATVSVRQLMVSEAARWIAVRRPRLMQVVTKEPQAQPGSVAIGSSKILFSL